MNNQRAVEINSRHPARSSRHAGQYTVSDLPIDEEGRIYHLQLKPGQIAPDILLVGDPGRAEVIGSTFLRDLEVEHEHRGLVTITGTSEITGEQATIISPARTTVATSGMGCPSLEIVVGELVALNVFLSSENEPTCSSKTGPLGAQRQRRDHRKRAHLIGENEPTR